MIYSEALDYIGSRLRFGIKPGLSRTRNLLKKLGNPEKKLNFLHVAGTNGKGSVCAMTSAALAAVGQKTGLYTSPYISDFRERMQINSCMIPKDELADIITAVKPFADNISDITEFELITCAAMLWFAENKCDIVVLETGLGGRFDSTNVIESPLCSVITKIGLDHTAVLGSTIEEIASEKSGIIKPGCPVVSSVQREEARKVIFDTAKNRGCRFIQAGECSAVLEQISGTHARYADIDTLYIPLAGHHQLENAAAAIEALKVIGMSDKDITEGIAKASIPARLEYMEGKPSLIIDGAHNPDGAQTLARALKDLTSGRRKIAVIGILEDKDYNTVLEILSPRFDIAISADGFSARELSSGKLAELISKHTYSIDGGNFSTAIDRAFDIAQDDDIIVVCGSLYLAGALRPVCLDRMRH